MNPVSSLSPKAKVTVEPVTLKTSFLPLLKVISYFSEPGNTQTNVQLAGNNTGNTINQYKLYSGGQAGYYWIDETGSSGGPFLCLLVQSAVWSVYGTCVKSVT